MVLAAGIWPMSDAGSFTILAGSSCMVLFKLDPYNFYC